MFAGYGIPDIVAWKSEVTRELQARGFVQYRGSIHELAVLPWRDRFSTESPDLKDDSVETLVGEVKGSDRTLGEAVRQLYRRGAEPNPNPGYLTSQCFDAGYGIIARARGWERSSAGTISFDEDGFYFNPDPVEETFSGGSVDGDSRAEDKRRQKLVDNLDRMACQTLLCNLSLEAIQDVVPVEGDMYPSEFCSEIWTLPPERVLDTVERMTAVETG